ncbi:MAG: hypothetical protein Phyf2KO_16200 [Phycisphaerales bacterium]
MAQTDPAEILLIQHRWANDQLLNACAKLTNDQLDREFEMGVGTLRRTLTHIAGAIRGWGDLLAGREQRPRLEEESLSIAELRELFEEVTTDFENSARTHPHDGIATGSRGGNSYSFTRGAVLTHVMTHAMHHRAQCLNMLRHLGVEQLPPNSVVEWMLMADPVS